MQQCTQRRHRDGTRGRDRAGAGSSCGSRRPRMPAWNNEGTWSQGMTPTPRWVVGWGPRRRERAGGGRAQSSNAALCHCPNIAGMLAGFAPWPPISFARLLACIARRPFYPLRQSLIVRRDFAHHPPRLCILHSFGLRQDFFGACSQISGERTKLEIRHWRLPCGNPSTEATTPAACVGFPT